MVQNVDKVETSDKRGAGGGNVAVGPGRRPVGPSDAEPDCKLEFELLSRLFNKKGNPNCGQ